MQIQKTLSRKRIWSLFLGNFFKHRDTALFGFLSAFLSSLFFPDKEPLRALILTYEMIPLRPKSLLQEVKS